MGLWYGQLLNGGPHELGSRYFGKDAVMPNWQGSVTNLQRPTLELH